MSYSCTDGFEDLMSVAQTLPHYDHAAESELDDDDVNGVAELALEAFQREALQKAALLTSARAMLAVLEAVRREPMTAARLASSYPAGTKFGIGWGGKQEAEGPSIHAMLESAIAQAEAAGIEPTP
jgi:hypothetical protein